LEDTFLQRPIHDGKQYQNLIPKSNCKVDFSGSENENTDFSIQEMVFMVKNYSFQMQEVAKLLKKDNLHDTVSAIHDFCYNHFQYTADFELQNMRSPACSWAVRYTGIDCKSYSILASSLLSEMNIDHAIRKVNYTHEIEAYSHVYIIVPVENNNLQNGYYIIDGTLKSNKELYFTEKNDTIMQHARLNSPNQGLYNPFLGEPNDEEDGKERVNWLSKAKDFIKDINFEKISGLFTSFACLGGVGFDDNSVKAGLNDINGAVNNLVLNVNTAIAENDMKKLSLMDAYFRAGFDLIINNIRLKHWGHFSNHCSDVNLDFLSEVYALNLSRYFGGNVYEAYVAKYFDTVVTGQTSFSIHEEQLLGSWWIEGTDDERCISPVRTFKIKKGINVPALEFTAPVVDAVNASQPIDVISALTSFQNIISAVVPKPTPNADGTYTDENGNQINPDGSPKPTPKQAGFGVIGWVALAAVIFGAVKLSKVDSKISKTKIK
jgi:hypothetical protein